MTTCIDVDVHTSLGAALQWDAREALHHLATCSICRDRLELLESVGSALREEVRVTPRFTYRVVLATAGAPEFARRS